MAGYDLGTAWIQVAISTNKLQSQIREAMGGVDTRPAENRIVGGLGGAFKQVGKIAATTLTTAATIGSRACSMKRVRRISWASSMP